jgi:hypothetical protein
MSVLVIILSTAIACVDLDCTQAIVGKDNKTPTGEYNSYYAKTNQYGYGGDVVVFKETTTSILAIHRPYPAITETNYRNRLLQNSDANKRKISNGCINVPSKFFDKYKYEINKVIIKEE